MSDTEPTTVPEPPIEVAVPVEPDTPNTVPDEVEVVVPGQTSFDKPLIAPPAIPVVEVVATPSTGTTGTGESMQGAMSALGASDAVPLDEVDADLLVAPDEEGLHTSDALPLEAFSIPETTASPSYLADDDDADEVINAVQTGDLVEEVEVQPVEQITVETVDPAVEDLPVAGPPGEPVVTTEADS